jgi:hypothetical protein
MAPAISLHGHCLRSHNVLLPSEAPTDRNRTKDGPAFRNRVLVSIYGLYGLRCGELF